MVKKTLAALLIASLLFCMTGCGKTAQQSIGGALTLEEFTQTFDVALQQQQQQEQGDTLSLPVTIGLRNSEELMEFMNAAVQGRPIVYENTLKEFNANGEPEEVKYTVDFDGQSAQITRDTGDGEPQVLHAVSFGMSMLAQACSDAEGNFDQLLFEQMIHSLELDFWYRSYPYHMLYGINALVAVTESGRYVVFDYYFDSSVVSMLGSYGMG